MLRQAAHKAHRAIWPAIQFAGARLLRGLGRHFRGALRDLWQHEHGHAGTRRNLCDARKLSLKATGGTEIEYMADLVCAITLAKIDVGLARLQSLLGSPSLGEACKWVGKLQATSPKPLFEIGGAASLAKQLKKLGLPLCRELLPPS